MLQRGYLTESIHNVSSYIVQEKDILKGGILQEGDNL